MRLGKGAGKEVGGRGRGLVRKEEALEEHDTLNEHRRMGNQERGKKKSELIFITRRTLWVIIL